MGQEAQCSVRFGDQVLEGRALLETDELVFRGEDGLRLKVPFKEMRSVEARDGELRVEFSDGPAVFQLGPRAAKWGAEDPEPEIAAGQAGR